MFKFVCLQHNQLPIIHSRRVAILVTKNVDYSQLGPKPSSQLNSTIALDFLHQAYMTLAI